jgi:S-formylglutathione hydrolase FrmB
MTSPILTLFTAIGLFSVLFRVDCYGAVTEDHTHYSTVLGMNRNYRIFLPPGYYQSGKRYPVLYWFHGSGGSSKQETYRSEFENYVDCHDLIIVKVDGSTGSGATWDYGLAFEYDRRTQENNKALTGMHFSIYIRELTGVIDSLYRTIPDRDHRAVSGQSMGGLMSPWIASQNKDLFGSASMFSPSPDAAMFGPEGREVCFVNRELYRSLKGIPLRITVAGGDRYRQYYFEQKAVWDLAGLTDFEFHVANYPDHRAVDIPSQFDFHMKQFSMVHPSPDNWNHADPFTDFKVWNYDISARRNEQAFTILEKVTPAGMMVCSRIFLPDGPIIRDERITITTDSIYKSSEYYILTDYNRSTGNVRTSRILSDNKGRLKINLDGGGHAIGINRENDKARLYLIPEFNREEIYCENGAVNTLNFTVINTGGSPSGPVHIRAFTPKSFLSFKEDTLTLGSLEPGQQVRITNRFPFIIACQKYGDPDNENFITKISLAITCNGTPQDVSDIFIFPVSNTSQLTVGSDLIILDGTARTVKCYDNRAHKDTLMTISGGSGNGNSIPEPGETIELWVCLARGLGLSDKNSFHPAFLVNCQEIPGIRVTRLKYNIKGSEYSGAANLQSCVTIDPDTPPGTELNLWLKCESYEFSEEGYNRPIQRHTFDFRRVVLRVGESAFATLPDHNSR